jgi:hypothetical protein
VERALTEHTAGWNVVLIGHYGLHTPGRLPSMSLDEFPFPCQILYTNPGDPANLPEGYDTYVHVSIKAKRVEE